jgi:hypothetical protein
MLNQTRSTIAITNIKHQTSSPVMTAAKKQETPASLGDKKTDGIPDEEVRQESSKAADAALAAQKKATELKKAAAGAGDAEERQKLMEQAIDAQVEAESFGKTAKYLRSGTFQGMAMGTGLGVAPGATLGALTGTLVGGVSSTILGGLGGGAGAVTGALHGPFVNLGQVAGKGIQKVTGNLPSWAATEDQKKTLEKMVGQVNEQEMPGKEELEKFKGDGAGMAAGGEDLGSWVKSAKDMMPSMGGKKSDAEPAEPKKKPRKLESRSNNSSAQGTETADRKKPRKLEASSNDNNEQPADAKADKKPPKLQSKAEDSKKTTTQSTSTKGQPPKLEERS